jgi:integrase
MSFPLFRFSVLPVFKPALIGPGVITTFSYHGVLAVRADLWRRRAGLAEEEATWRQAADRWCLEKRGKKSIRDDVSRLKWLTARLGEQPLNSLSSTYLRDVLDQKLAQGASPATVNRYAALLRSILRRCERVWRWMERAPVIDIPSEPPKRFYVLTRQQADRLLAELPMHLASMAEFSLATGLRMSNVTGLEWGQVDRGSGLAWIFPDQAKAGRAIGVPLNDTAMRVLKVVEGQHTRFVFTYEGRKVARTSTAAWYKACRRAGLEGLRWHDLRHTWASWHAKAGTPSNVLQELGGWSTQQMVKRYAHFTASELRPYACAIDGSEAPDGSTG